MLLAEDPLDLLIDRLRGLSPADRHAILQRLPASERRRIERALVAPSAMAGPRFAPDIAARIAAPDDGMTAATREVLLRVAGAAAPIGKPHPNPSLIARFGDAMRRR